MSSPDQEVKIDFFYETVGSPPTDYILILNINNKKSEVQN